MDKKKVIEILNNLEEVPNKELIVCLDYLNNEFQQTKNSILRLTNYLDNTEIVYNKILKEYEKRNNG